MCLKAVFIIATFDIRRPRYGSTSVFYGKKLHERGSENAKLNPLRAGKHQYSRALKSFIRLKRQSRASSEEAIERRFS